MRLSGAQPGERRETWMSQSLDGLAGPLGPKEGSDPNIRTGFQGGRVFPEAFRI